MTHKSNSKKNKYLILGLSLSAVFSISCALQKTKIEAPAPPPELSRAPNQANSQEAGYVSETNLKELGAAGVLNYLSEHCCDGIIFEKSDMQFWGVSEIEYLRTKINDDSPAAPIVSPTSSQACLGEQYASTVGWEAKHLLKAITKKKFPLANCSTYDLNLEN